MDKDSSLVFNSSGSSDVFNQCPKKMSASIFTAPVAGSGYLGLKPTSKALLPVKDSIAWSSKTVSNGSKTRCMKTWNPINNKKFEALSYLPSLSDDSIAKEIDYMLKKGWIPCLEFDEVGYVHRENSRMPGYYDGRYWTMWKLPMFGCNDSSQILNEIQECKKAYPNAYIRCLAFNNQKQGQCMSFLIQKPTTTTST
ncbi:Ribulose bisphosphate carboxylase small chain [Citrus sinensis]|uniref:ribulose bisphosphate carboxylase small chain clone 512 isoform X2 n=1 Tax=Citrus clementina TaxID=85681 RepID=UPI0007635B4D|nr:ribulose bisphosphate carboxylase small chain clone 512 isoform X2 [Citrus x clementina]XP_015384504.1 ribulose bisphosphate carboxylase small subunit, chloroplastic 3-like isoform X2 [Citrus sinensis]KAH9653903.1 Ribulose bisphosphate carboxylase small chain [Citrus sinensis]